MKLISTDFDGTVVGHHPDQYRPDALVAWIDAWRRDEGGIWMLSTGRWVESVEERMAALDVPAWPDWVCAGEREVWRLGPCGRRYVAHQPWNDRCSAVHYALVRRHAWARDAFFEHIDEQPGAIPLTERGELSGALAATDEQADRIEDFMRDIARRCPEMTAARNGRYFRLSHVSYHKGACVREVGRVVGAAPEQTFACGDSFNDIPMLAPAVARFLACPSNAVPQVERAVRHGGGYVSSRVYGEGLLDALVHYSKDRLTA